VFVDAFLIDGTYPVEIDIDSIDIQQRHTEFMGGGYGYRAGIGQVLINEICDQRQFIFLCTFHGLNEPILTNQAILDETPGQACEVCLSCGCCHGEKSAQTFL